MACRYECHRSDEREGARKTPGRQNESMTAPSNFTIRNNVFILCLSQDLNCQQLCHHTLSPLARFCIQHITRHNNSFSPVSHPVKPSCMLHRDFLPHNWGLNRQVIQQCSLMHSLFDISSLCYPSLASTLLAFWTHVHILKSILSFKSIFP